MLPPYLALETLYAIIDNALAEDVGGGDVTTLATIPEEKTAEAAFLAKEDGIVAGLEVVEHVFKRIDPEIRLTWVAADGDPVRAGQIFGAVHGRARGLLTGERLALNLLQRMSGIASATHLMVEAVKPHRARILDTRKTAPGLRLLDKWAVRIGGGENHRLGLYDMILIKDNHIDAAGGIRKAIEAAHRYCANNRVEVKIEVEARTLEDVQEILDTGGVQYVLLDNMVRRGPNGEIDTTMLQRAVSLVDGRILTEASGNVTLETAQAIAATGVDYISSGSLTHSVSALDVSLKIRLQ